MELQDAAGTDSESGSSAGHTLFSEKVQESQRAIQRGDFHSAVKLYTDAIELDPVSHTVLYHVVLE